MSRKEIDFTIVDDNRDKGKVFHLKELSALSAERWARRALKVIGRGALEVKQTIENTGMAGIWALGLNALLYADKDAEIDALLDEMLQCVTIQEKMPNGALGYRSLMGEDDIEEVGTVFALRQKVLELHLNFSIPAVQSKPLAETATTEPEPTVSAPSTKNTPMSPRQLARSAVLAKHRSQNALRS